MKKIVENTELSMYVITHSSMNNRLSIENILKHLATEIPMHADMILDIKKKFVIFPKPINGKMIYNKY